VRRQAAQQLLQRGLTSQLPVRTLVSGTLIAPSPGSPRRRAPQHGVHRFRHHVHVVKVFQDVRRHPAGRPDPNTQNWHVRTPPVTAPANDGGLSPEPEP
jgi:hypothetical protein